jgi:hypothetical protein
MVTLVACGSSSQTSSGSTASPSSSGFPSVDPATGSPYGAHALTGTWQSDPITAADVDSVLRREFSGSDVDRWERVSSCYPTPSQTWVQVLHLEGGQLVISTAKDGGDPHEGWTGPFVRRDANTFRAGDGLYITVDYKIEGGRLFTDLIKDDYSPLSQRLGDTMCLVTAYEIAPFTRIA